jgi:hypothetical protein
MVNWGGIAMQSFRFIYGCTWILGAVFWLTAPKGAWGVDVFFNDGQAHSLNDGTYQVDRIVVRNAGCEGYVTCASPGAATVVTVQLGAVIDQMISYDTSEIHIEAGTASSGSPKTVKAMDESAIVMTGGSVGYQLRAEEDSTVEVYGGTVGQSFIATGSALAILDGGSVVGSFSGYGSAELEMEAGKVEVTLTANDSSQMVVTGGDFSTLDRIEANNTLSRIDILGSGFASNGTPIEYGLLPVETGTLTGTLQSGEGINNHYYHNGYTTKTGKIYVPEPSLFSLQLAALSVLGLLLGNRSRVG